MAEGNNGEIGNGRVKGEMKKGGAWLREVTGNQGMSESKGKWKREG